jgi:hypothetical protein
MKTITATAGPGQYIPWSQTPSHVREMVPHLAPKMAVTRDGKLVCGCDARGNCTCRIATRDQKPRPGIGHSHLIAAVLALRNIHDRLERVEQHFAGQAQGMTQRNPMLSLRRLIKRPAILSPRDTLKKSMRKSRRVTKSAPKNWIVKCMAKTRRRTSRRCPMTTAINS